MKLVFNVFFCSGIKYVTNSINVDRNSSYKGKTYFSGYVHVDVGLS